MHGERILSCDGAIRKCWRKVDHHKLMIYEFMEELGQCCMCATLNELSLWPGHPDLGDKRVQERVKRLFLHHFNTGRQPRCPYPATKEGEICLKLSRRRPKRMTP